MKNLFPMILWNLWNLLIGDEFVKILVTGINGFVGSSLIPFFAGNYVIGVGRQDYCDIDINCYLKWDITYWDPDKFAQIGDVDVIIHAAASLSVDDDDPDIVNVNCLGTYNVYKLAKYTKAKQVFYISSAPIIGIPIEHPITEKHILEPQLMYHATKLCGEYILNQLNKLGIEVINLRINAPIGARMQIKSIVPIFIDNAIKGHDLILNGKGSRKQTYLDVRDLGDVICKNLLKMGINGVYILAGDKAISNIDLARLCIEICNSKSKIVFSGCYDEADEIIWDYDCSKAKKILNFSPRYSIEDSIRWIASKKC